MRKYTQPRWSKTERKILYTSLGEGVEVKFISTQLPIRTDEAIIRQAQKLGYGLKTVDEVQYLYIGVKHRSKKDDDTVEVTLNTASTDTIKNGSSDILSENTLNTTNREAIYLAVKILDDNNLKIDPSIVCVLSTHILSTEL